MRDAQRPSTTRRTVLRTAAWTAPAIAAGAAAPAHAASTPGSLLATFGATGITDAPIPGYVFIGASGMSVTSSTALAAGDLTLVARLVPQSASLSASRYVPGWQHVSNDGLTATYQYPSAVTAGAVVPFPDGAFLAVQEGVAVAVHLVFIATGAGSSQELVIETGGTEPAARQAPASSSSALPWD